MVPKTSITRALVTSVSYFILADDQGIFPDLTSAPPAANVISKISSTLNYQVLHKLLVLFFTFED